MKKNKLSIGLILLSVAIVCTYCTKEESSLVPEGELLMLKKAKTSNYIPGTDITEQLRSDLESGLSVTLPAGHFYLSEGVWTDGYTGGTVKGSGRDLTIIETAEGFLPPDDPYLNGRVSAGILTFQNPVGDITIKAMSFLVQGEHPAVGHIYPFGGYYSTNIENVILVAGTGASLECKDLFIKGEYVGDIEGAYLGYNISFPIVGTGFMCSGPFNKISVKDCEIDGCGGSAMGIWTGRTAEFKDNKITNAGMGLWLIDAIEAITIKDCHFENTSLVILQQNIADDCLYCFKDNTLDGQAMEDDCQ
ncbi:MAG: hypothetical protein ACQERS_02730 [Bacteroidota bacterium]